MDDFGFIITRHVNSPKTNKYWNNCIRLLHHFYPLQKIIIIDDNSNYEYIEPTNNIPIQVIQSEFKGRGELLPYYYFLKYKFFKNAVIMHDSVFIHKYINFKVLNGINVIPLWHFTNDRENFENTKRIANGLSNNETILGKIFNPNYKLFDITTSDKWNGCFGVQSYINLFFLQQLQSKYNIINLTSYITCRKDRCCLERIFGIMFCIEYPRMNKTPSLFGNIMSYQQWGYSYDTYISDLKKGNLPKYVVKIWTGR